MPEENIISLGSRVTGSHEIPNISAQIGTLNPMIEQQVLLITEPPLQSEAGVLKRPLRDSKDRIMLDLGMVKLVSLKGFTLIKGTRPSVCV